MRLMNFKASCAFSKVACLDLAVTNTPTVPHARLSTRLKIVPTCYGNTQSQGVCLVGGITSPTSILCMYVASTVDGDENEKHVGLGHITQHFFSRVEKKAHLLNSRQVFGLTCVHKSNEMPSSRQSLKNTGTRIDRKLGWCT